MKKATKDKKRQPTEKQLLNLLQDIEKGKVSVNLDEQASAQAMEWENGIHYFDTSNKWRIGVFVDCGRFDYVDSMQHGGTKVEYWQLDKFYPETTMYANRFRDVELGKRIWGIEAKMYADLQ